jgi:hypothetical protein
MSEQSEDDGEVIVPTVLGLWTVFESQVIDADAPEVQRNEMQLAFYAGFSAALGTLRKVADLGLTDEQAVAMIDQWWKECGEFVHSRGEPCRATS